MKTLSSMELRINNAHSIIRSLEINKVSTNRDLAPLCGMSGGTISNIVSLLKLKQLIIDVGTEKSAGGRRAVNISLNGAFGHYLGVSIMKHIYYVTVIDFTGNVEAYESNYLQFTGDDAYWSSVKLKCDQIIASLNVPVSIAIALPGIVDTRTRTLRHSQSLSETPIDLAPMYRQFGDDVLCGDSARLSGLSQIFDRTNYEKTVYLMLSRRISGTLILDNEITTLNPSDCSFGSMIINTVEKDEDHETPGFRGTFGYYCSSSRIIDILRSRGLNTEYAEFFELIRQGNEEYRSLWNEYLHYLAIGIHNIRAVFGLDIVIGGQMCGYIEPFFPQLCDEVSRLDLENDPHSYIMFSRYGEYDEAIGASLLARSEHLKKTLKEL